MGAIDAVLLDPNEDPRQALIEAVVHSISTEVWVTAAGVKMFLAAWQDPDHWSDDWREKGIDPDDVDALLAAAVTGEP